MGPLTSAVAVLTAMITPAVLISACGSMILSSSHRLGRVVDRVRALSDKLDELFGKGAHETKDRQTIIFEQLDKLTSRARILQRAMVTFYLALGMFVATSMGDRGGRLRTKQTTLQYGASSSWSARRLLSFLRQHAFDFRSAAGAKHDSRGDGLHLAAADTRGAG